MLIPIDSAVSSAVAYLSGEVAKVANLKDRFLMFAALGAIKANPSAIVKAYKPVFHSVGIVDDADMVDTDAVRSALDLAFANVPKVTIFGFTFNKDDAEALLHRMEQ